MLDILAPGKMECGKMGEHVAKPINGLPWWAIGQSNQEKYPQVYIRFLAQWVLDERPQDTFRRQGW